MLNRRRLGLAAGMAAAVSLTAAALVASTADAQEVGAPAPGFTAATSAGEMAALAGLANDRPVPTPTFNANSCSVKYAS